MAARDESKLSVKDRIRQFRDIFRMTRQADPAVIWWMLAAFLATIAVGFAVSLLMGGVLIIFISSILLGVMVAFLVMAKRAEKAAYSQIAGQPGASAAGLQGLRRGWNVETEPVAVDPRTQDLIFRAVGRPGVVLIAEGPTNRVRKLVETERKRVSRLVGANVPVTVVNAGDGEDQVPLAKLSRHISKLRPVLTKQQVSDICKRLAALGGVKMPVPKGMDPMRARPDRKGIKGR